MQSINFEQINNFTRKLLLLLRYLKKKNEILEKFKDSKVDTFK